MKAGSKNRVTPNDYLKRPYARVVVKEEDGSFRAEIQEFPGCIALGDTPAEAVTQLEEIAEAWIEASLARGQTIPEPLAETEFSGRLVLRLPRSLHRKAARAARADQVSLNQFIVAALAEHVGAATGRTSDRLANAAFSTALSLRLLQAKVSSLRSVYDPDWLSKMNTSGGSLVLSSGMERVN
jgi:predicted RNase H-like HicB family nuclease